MPITGGGKNRIAFVRFERDELRRKLFAGDCRRLQSKQTDKGK
jgi:hypothetical protein